MALLVTESSGSRAVFGSTGSTHLEREVLASHSSKCLAGSLCARLIGDQSTNELNSAGSYLSLRQPKTIRTGWRSGKLARPIRIDISPT